jgi:serine/threonine protein kinase
MDNILKRLKPIKFLGKGSQGKIFLGYNKLKKKKYSVKVYNGTIYDLDIIIKIIKHLHSKKNIPTIYKSYYITTSLNSSSKYIDNNILPEYFSCQINNKYSNIQYKLFEIMKNYNTTLKVFLQGLNYKDKKNDKLIKSIFQQGIITLLWLYIEKNIIHNDITLNNFFIVKTNKKMLNIKILNKNFSIHLYGYLIIIFDFGYSKYTKSKYICDKNTNIKFQKNKLYYDLNPLHDIIRFTNLILKKNSDNYFNNNDSINHLYKKMFLQKNNVSYNNYLTIYKKKLLEYIEKNIL